VKAIRGATSIEKDCQEEIRNSVIELMEQIFSRNEITELHSVIFTVTNDITSYNPATAFRKAFNQSDVALLCLYEASFGGSTNGIIRVLVHCESKTKNFVYLRRAKNLRPDQVLKEDSFI